MPQLESIIEKAADAFALSIIDAVKGASLQELLAMQGAAAPVVTGAKRRGRPPKVKPGRKPGRPPKVKPGRKPGRPAKAKPGRKPGRPPEATAKKAIAKTLPKKATKKTAKKTAMTAANKKRSANYPKCAIPGCGKNRYSKGNGMCGAHFKAAQAG